MINTVIKYNYIYSVTACCYQRATCTRVDHVVYEHKKWSKSINVTGIFLL